MEQYDSNHRVLILTDGLGIGGIERQVALTVKYLPRDWQPRVWSLGNGPFVQVIREIGVQVNVCPRRYRWDPSPAFHLWNTIREWKPHLIHSWGWMSSMAAVPVAKLFGIPIVNATIQAGRKPPRRVWALGLSMMWASRIVANSRAGIDAWQIPPHRARVIYNGFDPERFKLCVRQERRANDPFTIVMTARMVAEKDYRTVIESAHLLATSSRRRWRFLLVGDGADRANLIALAQDLVDSEIVQFPEPRLEVIDLLAQSDVGVLMSNPLIAAEGISNSIMEYMACGLPVVCADNGGSREIVLDGQNGFIIPPRDARALADRLIFLREHPEQAAQMGAVGKQRILTHFSTEKMIEQTLAIYREVL
jgi:glycosyltransferase involved in cell wall biosynthesis